MMYNMTRISLAAAFLMVSVFGYAQAQMPADPAAPAVAETVAPDASADAAASTTPATPVADVNVFTGSLMFSPTDLLEIDRAKSGVVLPGAALSAEAAAQIPQIRRIILSGVFYRKPGDWTVWINGQKVTPGNLLPEIVGIDVINDRVRLKWFDIGLNGVISLEMRPRQIYDIGTGVMTRE